MGSFNRLWPFLASAIWLAVVLLAFMPMYFSARLRTKEANQAVDEQLGLKLILLSFCMLGAFWVASGVSGLLGFLLTFKDFKSTALAGLATTVAGAGAFLGGFILLQRSNWQQQTRATRLTLGATALVCCLAALYSLQIFLSAFIGASGIPWGYAWSLVIAPSLARFLAFGAVGVLALLRFGSMSGWSSKLSFGVGQSTAASGIGEAPTMMGQAAQPTASQAASMTPSTQPLQPATQSPQPIAPEPSASPPMANPAQYGQGPAVAPAPHQPGLPQPGLPQPPSPQGAPAIPQPHTRPAFPAAGTAPRFPAPGAPSVPPPGGVPPQGGQGGPRGGSGQPGNR